MVAPIAVAFFAQGVDIAILVGWAFALAASTFCPLFLLGIWWTRLTAAGAACGMVAGAVIATTLIIAGLVLEEPGGVAGALLAQPAIVSVPIAFLAMIVVSLRARERPTPTRKCSRSMRRRVSTCPSWASATRLSGPRATG